jgi:UDP-N-acetylmuramoyl-tripeptide--D-alanyl-D-alanine ligase
VQPGEVFWSVSTTPDRGNLAEEAFARGALGVVAAGRRVEPWAGTFSIEVDDPKWALWQLGRTLRSRYGGRVIAVAGGPGKTLARAMIAHVLEHEFSGASADDTARHRDYLHVGLPLALSDLDDDAHDYALFELHGCRPDELAAETGLCRPDVAVITPDNEEGGTVRVPDHDLPWMETLREGAVVVLCDDVWRGGRRASGAARREPPFVGHVNTMRVGRGADCDLVAEQVLYAGGELSMVLAGLPVRVPVWGRHHLPSVLAAFAVGRLMGLPDERVAASLTRFAPPEGRCSVALRDGVTVVDDSSCPSPTAARAALAAMRDAARNGRRLAVLGEFAGAAAETYRCLGSAAVAQGGVDGLIACGAGAEQVITAAREAGMPDRAAQACEAEDAAEAMLALARSGDTVLVVGGPAEAMSRLAKQLAGDATNQEQSCAAAACASPRLIDPFEVPPLVPAMREAGAALPPGLEH